MNTDNIAKRTPARSQAQCRNCKKPLIGDDYMYGGLAYFPVTMKSVAVNQYGGFVCSESCDIAVCREVESSMPGTGKLTSLSTYSQAKIKSNWSK